MDAFVEPRSSQDVLPEKPPLAGLAATQALVRCMMATTGLLWRHQIHLPRCRVGMRLRFADDTSAYVFRETVVRKQVMLAVSDLTRRNGTSPSWRQAATPTPR